jgi:hypothetical protein
VDSRVDIFEYSGVLKDYLDLLALDDPQRILSRYNIRYVLFPPGEPLTYVLLHDPNWRVLYSDRISVLLERRSEASSVLASTSGAVPNQRSSLPLTEHDELTWGFSRQGSDLVK